ncbi:MAG: hypothetical protein MJA83_18445 [Gammaproteobacteria bacterium]|nr:hypothetical protein [Gammaproteobacteria bacterium]
MATWQNANLDKFLPDQFTTLLSTTTTTTSSVSTTLSTIRTAVEAIKIFLVPIPAFDFASVLIEAVNTFRTDFLGTGYFAANMWDYPLQQKARSGFSGEPFSTSFVNDLANSFTDENDPNRPTFTGDAAMIVFVGGGPGFEGVLSIVESASASFSWWIELVQVFASLTREDDTRQLEIIEDKIKSGEIQIIESDAPPALKTKNLLNFIRAKKSFSEFRDAVSGITIPDTDNPSSQDLLQFISDVESNVGSTRYPDWQAISLRTIVAPLVDVVDAAFDPLIESLQSGASVVDTIDGYIETLGEKIDSLDNILTSIDSFTSQLNSLLGLTGLSALFIETSNGVTGLADDLVNASSPPFDGLDNGFYSGFAVVAGGAALTPFVNLFKPIGT